MNKTLLFALFCCVALATATEMTQVEEEAKYTIDQATDILIELLDDAVQNKKDLENNWSETKPILEANIESISTQLSNKTEECAALDVILAGHEKELEDANKYLSWLLTRITENEERIITILAQRCEQNSLYIDALKNDKIALKLIEYLRSQINAKESFSLAERKAFSKKLASFLAIYQKGDLSELLELEKQVAADYEVNSNQEVKGRTDEEIGAAHVDNDQDELELEGFQNGARKGWGDIRAELLSILNDLEVTILDKIRTGQEDEIRSSTTTADYKLRLEHEIEVYQREVVKVQANISRLEGLVADDKANVTRCRSEEQTIKGQLETAKEDLVVATEQFNHKNANFDEEIAIFQEVLTLYLPSTGVQSNEFKDRAEDYIEDQDFDNEQYSDREVPHIDLINSQ